MYQAVIIQALIVSNVHLKQMSNIKLFLNKFKSLKSLIRKYLSLPLRQSQNEQSTGFD